MAEWWRQTRLRKTCMSRSHQVAPGRWRLIAVYSNRPAGVRVMRVETASGSREDAQALLAGLEASARREGEARALEAKRAAAQADGQMQLFACA